MFEQYGLHLAIACAAVAILYGIVVARWIVAQPAGNEKCRASPRPSRKVPAPT